VKMVKQAVLDGLTSDVVSLIIVTDVSYLSDYLGSSPDFFRLSQFFIRRPTKVFGLLKI